ncbi:MAG: hypothetical protein WC558_16730, partial [Patulibacter sp.]
KTGAIGLDLRGSARVERAAVAIAASQIAKGSVADSATNPSAPVTIEDSSISAVSGGLATGVQGNTAQLAIRRSTITAPDGPLNVTNGALRVESSLLRGRNSRILANLPAGAGATIESSTLVGDGTGRGLTAATDGGPTNVTLGSSIVEDFSTGIERMTFSTGAATVQLAQTNLRAGIPTVVLGAVTGSTTQTDTTSFDPDFVDAGAGDYRLTADSPLIDRGTAPAPPGLGPDRDGNERVVDGNGDGIARLDLGAYERAAPPVVPDPPLVGDPGPPVIGNPGPPAVPPGPPVVVVPAAGFGRATKVRVALRTKRPAPLNRLVLSIANDNAFAIGTGVTVTLKRAGRRKAVRVPAIRTTVGARRTGAVRLRLTAANRRALRGAKRITVRVVVRASAPDGGRRTVTKTLAARLR